MRMPISLVRRDTLNDIRPNRPIDASSARARRRATSRSRTAAPAEAALDLLGLCRDVRQRQRRIDTPHGGAHRLDSALGSPAVRRQFMPRTGHCRVRLVDRRRRRVAQARVLRIANDADDLEILCCSRGEPPNVRPSADCVGEHFLRRRLVDDHDLRRRLGVGAPEAAAAPAAGSPWCRRTRARSTSCGCLPSCRPAGSSATCFGCPRGAGARERDRADARQRLQLSCICASSCADAIGS